MSDVPELWSAPGDEVAAVNPDDLRNGMGNGAWRSGASRRSAAALDRHRTPGSREEVPTHQRLSRNPVAEGTPKSVAPSAEGGSDRRSRLNLVAGRLTVPNIESRCNQLKLGHPRKLCPKNCAIQGVHPNKLGPIGAEQ